MPQISIRPGDSLTVAEDITIRFDKFDFIDGCSRLFISVAKQELRESRHQRQAEGIAAAKARGVQLGRSPKPLPDNFEECYQKWRDGEISMREAASACGMSKTWFRDAAMRKEQSAECAV